MTENQLKRQELSMAMFAPGLPCNPVPFLNGLAEGVKEHGTDYIRTDEAKRILWVINTMVHGQLATINQVELYAKLKPKQQETLNL